MLNIDKFLEFLSCELNRSQKTVESYRDDLSRFEIFARDLSESFSWETVDIDMVRDWMESMIENGNSARTVARRLSALKTFYRFALARHYIVSDPVHRLRSPKIEKPLPQFLKESEMDELLDKQSWGDSFEEIRTRTIIIMFYETGVRVSELVGLDLRDVDEVSREIRVLGKGNKQRIVPFGNELSETLRDYLKKREGNFDVKSSALFLTNKGERMSAQSVRYVVKKQLSKVSSLKKKSPHVLRHTFATAMLNHDAGIENLKKLLGHAKISTTEIYAHTTFEQLKRVYNEAHPRA